MNYQVYGNELYHHGILGQKWGVRRYQNPDGTYTSAGKARRNASSDDKNKITDDLQTLSKITDKVNNRIKPTKKTPSQEEIDEMSDEELRRQVKRKKLEKEYKDLNTETVNDGKSKVKEILEATSIALTSTAELIYIYYRIFGKDARGPSINHDKKKTINDKLRDELTKQESYDKTKIDRLRKTQI